MKKYQHKVYQYQKVTHKCQWRVAYINQYSSNKPAGKHSRKEMDQFKLSREMFINIDPCPSKEVQLLIKLHKTRATLVKYLSVRNQSDFKSRFVNSDAVFNILPKPGQNKAANLFPYRPGNPHVKAPRMKLSDMFLISPYTTCSKRRSHRIADRLLNRGKTIMRSVRATIGIQFMLIQIITHHFQVIRGNQTVRIKDYKVITPGLFKTKVPAKTLSGIGFHKIFNIQQIAVLFYNLLCVIDRTILYHQYLKLQITLFGQGMQQLIYLLRTIIQRNNYRKKHRLSSLLFNQVVVTLRCITGYQFCHEPCQKQLLTNNY